VRQKQVYDGDREQSHLIATLLPVAHEFVRLNLFFTARQTVAFATTGPNAVSICGILELAEAQEEDLMSQMSNDFISAQLGFGGQREEEEIEEAMSPEQVFMLERLLGGIAQEQEKEAQVQVEEEAPAKNKKKKKQKKKQKTDASAIVPVEAPVVIANDSLQRMPESAKRRCVARVTEGWGAVAEGSVSSVCCMWTAHAPNSEQAVVNDGRALRLACLSLESGSRQHKELSLVASREGATVRLGLGLLPPSLEAVFKGLRRGSRRLVWLSRSALRKDDWPVLAQLLEVDAAVLTGPKESEQKDGDLFLQITA
jgi:hypothetical protein